MLQLSPSTADFRTTGIDEGCMGVHDIQIGFCSLIAILFINGEISPPFGKMLIEPLLGSFARFMKNGRDLACAHMDSQKLLQTDLDPLTTCMALREQDQDCSFYLRYPFG